jgi:hypothetical protein
MEIHKIGQEPTIKDVCRSCNGGVLSRLDEAAKEWWDASEGATKPIVPGPQGILARWLGKVVYNVQRIEKRERGSIGGPPVPDLMRAWILGEARAERRISAWVSVFPENHDGAFHSGIAGNDDRPDSPVWLVGLHRFFFCVAWDHPIGNGFAKAIEAEVRTSLPAASLDLDGDSNDSMDVPTLRDPDRVYESLYRGAAQFRDQALGA